MEASFENENTCDVFMNEVRIEDEMLLELEEMNTLQTKRSRNPEMNQNNLKKLHAQKTFWKRTS
jgi:hypothetical protein